MADSIRLDELPGALSGTMIVGDGRTWTATEGTGNTWPASTRLRIINAAGTETVLTPVIAGTLATWTVTVAETAALRGTKVSGSLHARITTGTGDALRPWAAGRISIVSAHVGSRVAQSLGTVTLGPAGAAVESVALVAGDLVFTLENGVTLPAVDVPALDAAASSAAAALASQNAAAGSAGNADAAKVAAQSAKTDAESARDAAGASASAASGSAGTATTQAGTATTKAGEASASAAAALASQNSATASAGTATTKAGESAASAAAALASQNSATASAGTATTKAGESAASAAAALVSQNAASATLTNAVRGDIVQSLTPAAKLQARTNAGVIETVLTNLVINGDFSNGTTGWSFADATLAIESGRLAVTPSAQWGAATQWVEGVTGHRYYRAVSCETTATGPYIGSWALSDQPFQIGQSRISSVLTANVDAANLIVADFRTSGWTKFYADNVLLIDLTAAFGAGLEPTKEEMDLYLAAAHTNSWFDGTVTLNHQIWGKVNRESVRNLVTNGDLSNGVTGWSGDGTSTLAASGGVLSGTGLGAASYQYAAIACGFRNGQKIYVAAQVRATSTADSISIQAAGIAAATATSPVVGQWYSLSGIVTASSNGAVSPCLALAQYASAAAQAGSTFEAKYLTYIDLTATFGAGNEPTKSEMDYLLSLYPNSWFNGTVNDLVPRYNPRDRIGSGSPEGVVTAPIGTDWTDILDTCGATKWIKKSGTGNTGWKVSVGDTGWRTAHELLVFGWTQWDAYPLRIRRVGNQVLMDGVMKGIAKTASTFLDPMPQGFAVSTGTYGSAIVNWDTFLAYPTTISVTGIRSDAAPAGYYSVNGLSWTTDAAWPTILPGSAA